MRNLAIQCAEHRVSHYQRIFDLCSFFNIDFYSSIDLNRAQYRYSTMIIESVEGEALLDYKKLLCANEYLPKTIIIQDTSNVKLGLEFARLGVEGLVSQNTHPLDLIEIVKKVDFGGIYYAEVFLKEILKNLQMEHFRHELSVA